MNLELIDQIVMNFIKKNAYILFIILFIGMFYSFFRLFKLFKEDYNKKYINPEKYNHLCKICKKKMRYIHNVFSLNYYCSNEKCKGYLLREGGIQKDLWGNIERKDVK